MDIFQNKVFVLLLFFNIYEVASLEFKQSPRSSLCWRHHESLLNGTCFRVIDGSKEILLRANWSSLNYTFHVNGHSNVNVSMTFRKSFVETEKEPLYLENEDTEEKLRREFQENTNELNKGNFKQLAEENRKLRIEEEQKKQEQSRLYHRALWVELKDQLDDPIPDVQLSFQNK